MARPRGKIADTGPTLEPGATATEPTALELVHDTVETLRASPHETDGAIASALSTLALKIDSQRPVPTTLEVTEGDVAVAVVLAESMRALSDRVASLSERVDELAAANVVVEAVVPEGGDGSVYEVRGTSLVERVVELEQRVHEAGRLLVFHGGRRPGGMTPAPAYLDEVGRALLFDGEQPEATPDDGNAA